MLSVVVPVHNESGNIGSLVAEIASLAIRIPLMEIIYVDDGSTDDTVAQLLQAQAEQPMLRILTQTPRAGQSAATWAGVEAAMQPLVATLDGDGQNDPEGLITMFETFMAASQSNPHIMVAGQRARREDNKLRVISSRVANGVRDMILRDGVRDTGCALKMFRRDDYLRLPYFDHMHRFLPALFLRDGIAVHLSDVRHRPRLCGASKYGVMNRLWVGIIDLFGVAWLQARAKPPTLKIDEVK